jgi:hypothetical protein
MQKHQHIEKREEMEDDLRSREVEAMNQRVCLYLARNPEMCSPPLDRFGVAIRSVSDHSNCFIIRRDLGTRTYQHLAIIITGFI